MRDDFVICSNTSGTMKSQMKTSNYSIVVFCKICLHTKELCSKMLFAYAPLMHWWMRLITIALVPVISPCLLFQQCIRGQVHQKRARIQQKVLSRSFFLWRVPK